MGVLLRDKNHIPQYSFRDHPYIQDGQAMGRSEYIDKFQSQKDRLDSSTVYKSMDKEGNSRLFESQVGNGQDDRNGQKTYPQQETRMQEVKYPSNYGSHDQRMMEGQPQNEKLPAYERGDTMNDRRTNEMKYEPNPYNNGHAMNPAVNKQSVVRDSLDALQENIGIQGDKSRAGYYQRRPEREEFDENYLQHQLMLERRITKFSKSRESTDSPLNIPPSYTGRGMSTYQMTERIAKTDYSGNPQSKTGQPSQENRVQGGQQQNYGAARMENEGYYKDISTQRVNFKDEQVQTSPMNGYQNQAGYESGQYRPKANPNGMSNHNLYSENQTERGSQANPSQYRSEKAMY